MFKIVFKIFNISTFSSNLSTFIFISIANILTCLTCRSSESLDAVTREHVDAIRASAKVLARIAGTLVDICSYERYVSFMFRVMPFGMIILLTQFVRFAISFNTEWKFVLWDIQCFSISELFGFVPENQIEISRK